MIFVLSGGQEAHAAICVNYPENADCSCTQISTGKTQTAGNASGQWFFSAPKDGEYTVTVSDGTTTKTQDISISGKGSFAAVELSFWDGELFDSGNQFVDYTGGWGQNTTAKVGAITAGGTVSMGTNISVTGTGSQVAIAYTKSPIDLTEWTSLNWTVTSVPNEVYLVISKAASFASGDDLSSETYCAKISKVTNQTSCPSTVTVSLADVEGEHSIAVYCFHSSTATVGKVWLE